MSQTSRREPLDLDPLLDFDLLLDFGLIRTGVMRRLLLDFGLIRTGVMRRGDLVDDIY